MFSEIKKAACEFWTKIDQKYILTDEYFNNMSSHNDTVMNFFKTYTPLNPLQEAVVYLVIANQKQRELTKLQADSIVMDDKKNKMKENEGGKSIGLAHRRVLDLKSIEEVLPGLSEYKEPSEAEIKKYLERSNPSSFQNNVWIFMFYIAIFALTWISLEFKQESRQVYSMTKILESWLQSQNI